MKRAPAPQSTGSGLMAQGAERDKDWHHLSAPLQRVFPNGLGGLPADVRRDLVSGNVPLRDAVELMSHLEPHEEAEGGDYRPTTSPLAPRAHARRGGQPGVERGRGGHATRGGRSEQAYRACSVLPQCRAVVCEQQHVVRTLDS